MATKIQLRRDTAANWSQNNPVLSAGEIGLETDTLKFKIGNGSTAWNSISSYANVTPSGLQNSLDSFETLPSQSGNANRILYTDGSAATWVKPFVATANGNPQSPDDGEIYFNTTDFSLNVAYGGAWFVMSTASFEGGSPSTASFSETYDGGSPSTVNFDAVIDAGALS